MLQTNFQYGIIYFLNRFVYKIWGDTPHVNNFKGLFSFFFIQPASKKIIIIFSVPYNNEKQQNLIFDDRTFGIFILINDWTNQSIIRTIVDHFSSA